LAQAILDQGSAAPCGTLFGVAWRVSHLVAKVGLSEMLEGTAGSLNSTKHAPNKNIRVCMVVSWVLFVIFVFGLPWWSVLFNDTLGYGAVLCTADGPDTTCINRDDYAAWATENGRSRTRKDGSIWACSCEEGIFADSGCLSRQFAEFTQQRYWSISYYISTAPGTGGLVAVTAFPILFIWFYGGNNVVMMQGVLRASYTPQERVSRLSLITLSQAVFQTFYGLFLFFSVCVFPKLHLTVVTLFLVAEVSHMLLIATSVGRHTTVGIVILVVTITGMSLLLLLCALSLVTTFNGSTSTFSMYGFWLGECIGFSAMLSIPVILVWLPDAAYLNADEAAQPLATEKADADGK